MMTRVEFTKPVFQVDPVDLPTKGEHWIGPWDPNYPKGGNPVDPGVHVPWGQAHKAPSAPVTPEPVPVAPVPPAAPTPPVKAAARGAALRSLWTGLFIALMTGLATGLTAVPSGTNWFTKDGLLVTAAVVINAVIHSFLTYAQQLGWGPPSAGAEGAGDGK
jgi:hypothetical protein